MYSNSSPDETVELVNVRVSISLPRKNKFTIEKNQNLSSQNLKDIFIFQNHMAEKKGKFLLEGMSLVQTRYMDHQL